MTLKEIDRIRTALNNGHATTADFYSSLDEAVRFHHKVTELQSLLLVLKKKCEMEVKDIEDGKPLSTVHYALTLDYIMDLVETSRHIRAA